MDYLDWTSIGTTIFSIAGTILAGVLVWFIQEKVGETRVQTINQRLEKIGNEFLLKQAWAMEAVRYAEQTFIQGKGTQKYDAAVAFVSKKAGDYGIDITSDELKVLIESQVQKITQEVQAGWKETANGSGVNGTNPSFKAEVEASKKDWNHKI